MQYDKTVLLALANQLDREIIEECISKSSLQFKLVQLPPKELNAYLKEHFFPLIISYDDLADQLRESQPKSTVLKISVDVSTILKNLNYLKAQGCKHIYIIARSDDLQDFENIKEYLGLDSRVVIIPVAENQELATVLGDALLSGADGIIGSRQVVELCAHKQQVKTRELGLSRISMMRVFEAAGRIMHLEKVKRLQLTRLDLIINNIAEGVIIFNLQKEAVFHNVQADRIMSGVDLKDWYDLVEPYFSKTSNLNSVVTLNDHLVLMQTQRFVFPDTDIDNHVVIMQEGHEITRSGQLLNSHKIGKNLIAKSTFSSLIAVDPCTQEQIKIARHFAQSESTVLICGETGVGKEMFAQSIHNESARKGEPFVSINCAALPSSLIESELFGYVDGAFTGARAKGKLGLFELGQKGTIFLDEIGELPLDLQGRLLRVLQEKEIMRIGDDRIIPIDVRIICATNRDLKLQCAKELFRQDLFYRINVLHMVLPPLRERKEDILPLFERFLKQYFGQREFTVQADAARYLKDYLWPGNIRQLRNVAEACVINGPLVELKTVKVILEQSINPLDIPTAPAAALPACSTQSSGQCLTLNLAEIDSLKALEQQVLRELLKTQSQDEICQRFKISRVTLWRKLKANA
ncbi:MAG: sigma 54-interacting transcriptional regulator [Succinivibrio sp.]|nr:sigma 54-interacting transcriptional regulator [Succinivibrio sp.]